ESVWVFCPALHPATASAVTRPARPTANGALRSRSIDFSGARLTVAMSFLRRAATTREGYRGAAGRAAQGHRPRPERVHSGSSRTITAGHESHLTTRADARL